MFQIWQNSCMIFRTRLDSLSDPQYYRDLQWSFGWILPNNQYSVVFWRSPSQKKAPLICIYLYNKKIVLTQSRRFYFAVTLAPVGLLGDTWWSTLAIDHILVPINLPLSKEVVLKNAYFFQGVTRCFTLEKWNGNAWPDFVSWIFRRFFACLILLWKWGTCCLRALFDFLIYE